MKAFIHKEAHTNIRFISCDGRQLYDFKERGVDLEVESVRYIEMHRGPVSQDILTLGYFVAAAKYPRILCRSK